MFPIQDMTYRKTQGHLQETPPPLFNLEQNLWEKIGSVVVS